MGQMIRGAPSRKAGAFAFKPGQESRYPADICMRPRRCRDAGSKRRSMMDIISAGKAPVSHASQDKGDELTRIGDMARLFGVTLRALRFYEDKGLIQPIRQGTTRLYTK